MKTDHFLFFVILLFSTKILEAKVVFRSSFGFGKTQDIYFNKSIKNFAVNDYLDPESPIISFHQGIYYKRLIFPYFSLFFGGELSFQGIWGLAPERSGTTSKIDYYRSLSLIPSFIASYRLNPRLSIFAGGGVGGSLSFTGPLYVEIKGVNDEKIQINFLDEGLSLTYCLDSHVGVAYHMSQKMVFLIKTFLYYENKAQLGKNNYVKNLLDLVEEEKLKGKVKIPVADRIDSRLDSYTEIQNLLSLGLRIGFSYSL